MVSIRRKRENKSKKSKRKEVSAWRLMLMTKSGKIGFGLLIIMLVLAAGTVAYYGKTGMHQYMSSTLWPYKYPTAVPPSWAVKAKAPMADITQDQMKLIGPIITTKVQYFNNNPDTIRRLTLLTYLNNVEVVEKYEGSINYTGDFGAYPSDTYLGLILKVGNNTYASIGNNKKSIIIIVYAYIDRPDGTKVVFYKGPLQVSGTGQTIVLYGNIIQQVSGNETTLYLPASLNSLSVQQQAASSPIYPYVSQSLGPIAEKIAKEAHLKAVPLYGRALFATAKDGVMTTLNGEYKLHLEIYYFVNKSLATGPGGKLDYNTLSKNDATVTVKLYEIRVMANNWGLFGTDGKGRPIGIGLLFGLPYAFILGFFVTFTSTFIGALYGTAAGYWKDIRGEILMRIVDVVNSLPFLPILIALSIAIKTINLELLSFLMIILFWAGPVIIVRSMALQISEQIYVEAAKAVGASSRRIVFRHMFPQIFPYTMAIAVLSIPGIIITEASLALLGFGDPNAPTWGKMLQYAYDSGAVKNGWWWVVLFPGLALVVFSATFLLIGRAMEPIVAPKLVK